MVARDALMRHNCIMRTTVTLPDHLLVEAKRRAAETRTSLTAILTESLRMYLAQEYQTEAASKKNSPLPVIKTARPRRGVNLNDTSALLDLD